MELIAHLEVSAARSYTRVDRRPWGFLLHNPANPDNHDANCARWVRTLLPEAFIDEVVDFYRRRNVVPRVKINDLTEPGDLCWRLELRGFRSADTSCRVMGWYPELARADHAPPAETGPERRPPEGLAIGPATPSDVPAIAEIRARANGYDLGWVMRQTEYQVASGAVRYYLARLGGKAAACASVGYTGGAGRALVDHVATAPESRNLGLATALLQRIQADHSFPLFLLVADAAAERLYRNTGFRGLGWYRETTCWLEG